MFFRMLICLFALITFPSFAQNIQPITPEIQRRALQQLQSITPAQREAMIQKAQAAWQSMSPQDKDTLKTKAMQQWQNLTPAQKQQMQNQALQQWQNLSPQQKQQMASQFQNVLQGDLMNRALK